MKKFIYKNIRRKRKNLCERKDTQETIIFMASKTNVQATCIVADRTVGNSQYRTLFEPPESDIQPSEILFTHYPCQARTRGGQGLSTKIGRVLHPDCLHLVLEYRFVPSPVFVVMGLPQSPMEFCLLLFEPINALIINMLLLDCILPTNHCALHRYRLLQRWQ